MRDGPTASPAPSMAPPPSQEPGPFNTAPVLYYLFFIVNKVIILYCRAVYSASHTDF